MFPRTCRYGCGGWFRYCSAGAAVWSGERSVKGIGANKAQMEAITHGEGACLVLAGPGSGKTFTITKRILFLLEQGVAPETILVITFTKEAARSMGDRFLRMQGAGPVPPVNFGTFHSVFYHILRESKALSSGNLLKLSEKKKILLPILRALEGKESAGALEEDAQAVLAAISYYKNTCRPAEAGARMPARWQQNFEEIFASYDREVKKTGRIDFDDMLFGCGKLLQENAAVRAFWQKRFRHILMDEFQDINPVQYRVVKLLAARPWNLFAVGDDDQSIYGFRGSEPGCMRRFQEEFQARQILLDVNYRSTPGIVGASLAVIGENRDRFPKKLRAAASGEGTAPVVIRTFPEREEEYAFLGEQVSAAGDIQESRAVLFRTNAAMQGFAARLKGAGIPFQMRERAVSIYEHFVAADVTAYLQAAQGTARREQVLRIMNRPSRCLSREAVGEGTFDLGGMMAYYERAELPPGQKERAKNELLRLERQLGCLGQLPLRPAIHYILKAVGYERYLREASVGSPEKWQEWKEFLEWLMEDAGKHGSLKEWLEFRRDYAKTLEQREKGPGGPPRGEGEVLQLLTVHGSKGLEFDRVWIPDCNENVFPHGKMPAGDTLEEERRIFYVAMTRAKKSLELLCLTGTEERPRLPSRFLGPLWPSSQSSASSSNSQLSRYSSKASATFSYSSSSSI